MEILDEDKQLLADAEGDLAFMLTCWGGAEMEPERGWHRNYSALAARLRSLSAAHRRCEDYCKMCEETGIEINIRIASSIRAALAPASEVRDEGR